MGLNWVLQNAKGNTNLTRVPLWLLVELMYCYEILAKCSASLMQPIFWKEKQTQLGKRLLVC